jgi:hypothetical protein
MSVVNVGMYHQAGTTNIAGTVYCERLMVQRGPVATQYTPGAQPGATVGAAFGVNITGQAGTGDIANAAVNQLYSLYDADGVGRSNAA